MQKSVSQIRDLKKIEEELSKNGAGVLAIPNEEKVNQLTTSFLYLDKNIYFFFPNGDEKYDAVKLDQNVSFTVVKNSEKKTGKLSSKIFSITIFGILKKIDDSKVLEDIKENLITKYSLEKDENPLSNLLMIDSEEIQAFEEVIK